MGRERLGVVCLVPEPEATELRGLQRALGFRARMAPHVTLVPPVNVRTEQIERALDAVRAAASAGGPLALDLGPVATFWPASPVVYLAVGGDLDGLRGLRSRLRAGPFDRPEEWPFVPHATLAEDLAPARLAAATEALAGYRAAVTVERIDVLAQAVGGRWENVTDAPLGGPRVVGRGGLPVELVVHDTVTRARRPRPFEVVARREGVVVGAASGDTDGELRLGRLFVEPAARGQGVGTLLLREVELLGARRGCRRARATVEDASWLTSRGWHTDDAAVSVSRVLGRSL